MRIAYVCADPGVPVFGTKGCSVHVQEVVRALIGQGATVELFCARTGGPPPAGLEGVVVHQLRCPSGTDVSQREASLLKSNDDLTAALEGCEFDLVYERYSLWSYTAVEAAARRGVPCVLEVNAPLVEEQSRHRALVDREGALAVARRVFTGATAVAWVSDEVAAYVRTAGAAPDRVHTVPNGVTPARFSHNVRPSLPGPPGSFTVGFVGTLKPWHGVDVLIDAFAELHARVAAARLIIVGDGPVRDALTAAVAARGLAGAVHWTGAVEPAAVPGFVRSMDVAVAPYPAMSEFYFSPLKLYEYMAAGLAIVASEIGQIRNVLRDDETALLVPPGDARALAGALRRLWRDPNLRRQLGAAARAAVIEKGHSWDAVARRILDVAGLRPQIARPRAVTAT
jgi:glycosyltransferase involved in cell wall biosynthesis